MRTRTRWGFAVITLLLAGCSGTPDETSPVVDPSSSPPPGVATFDASSAPSQSASDLKDVSDELEFVSQMSMKQGVVDYLVTFRKSRIFPADRYLTNGQTSLGAKVDLSVAGCADGNPQTRIDPTKDAVIAFDWKIENLSNTEEPTSLAFHWMYERPDASSSPVQIMTIYYSGSATCYHESSMQSPYFTISHDGFYRGQAGRSAGFFVLKNFFVAGKPFYHGINALKDVLVGCSGVEFHSDVPSMPKIISHHGGFLPVDEYPNGDKYTIISNGTHLLGRVTE